MAKQTFAEMIATARERDRLTFELYEKLKNYRRVGKELGVSGAAVAIRVHRHQRNLRNAEIPHMALSVRVRQAMKFEGVDVSKPEEMAKLSRAYLMTIPNLGRKSVDELEAYLAGHGLKLAGDVEKPAPESEWKQGLLAEMIGEAREHGFSPAEEAQYLMKLVRFYILRRCPVCGRNVNVRTGGKLGEHSPNDYGRRCAGVGRQVIG